MTLKPGIYKATVSGTPDQVVMVSKDGFAYNAPGLDKHRDLVLTWDSRCEKITDARPLILLDFKAMNPKPIFTGLLRDHGYEWLANQIEAQTKPPRIEEPGLWGVVEASSKSFAGRREYVHEPRQNGSLEWHSTHGFTMWDSLIDPTLIREGLS